MKSHYRFIKSGLLILSGYHFLPAYGCTLSFTSPTRGATVTSQTVTIFGQGGADAQSGDHGAVTATLNGKTFFTYSGSFTSATSFLASRGVSVTLKKGINFLSVSGNAGSCNAEDTMTLYYDPDTTVASVAKSLGNGSDDLSNNAVCKIAGNPINFTNGNKYQEELDYQRFNTAFPLRFIRYYNSLDGYWRTNYSAQLSIGSGTVTLIFADGRQSQFPVSGSTVTSDSSELGTLKKTSTGWVYVSIDNETFIFNSSGKLTKWTNPVGLSHTLSYSSDSIVTVSDSFGNSFSFGVDAHNQPISLSGSDISIAYQYDTAHRLIRVVKTSGSLTTTRTYHYENTTFPRFLTGITDEKNIRFATYSYDSMGRAISTSHATGSDKVSVTYNDDGTSTVTNPLGKNTTYHYAVIDNVKRISQVDGEPTASCPSSNSTYTYNSIGLPVSKTDWQGDATAYEYNARGLVTKVTEAQGTNAERVTTTEWHSTLALPVKVTQGNQVVTYSYDSAGRLTGQQVSEQ